MKWIEGKYTDEDIRYNDMSYKYKHEYNLNGVKYFIICTQEEKLQIELRYGVCLSLVDWVVR